MQGYTLMTIASRARARLDERLEAMKPAGRLSPPHKGWVRAIRDALGMSGRQLGARMGITAQSVAELERSEALGTIRLNTLRRAAAALDCTLVYALVPNTSLAETVETRTRRLALHALGQVSHSMALEDQAVSERDLEERVRAYAAQALRARDLWEEP